MAKGGVASSFDTESSHSMIFASVNIEGPGRPLYEPFRLSSQALQWARKCFSKSGGTASPQMVFRTHRSLACGIAMFNSCVIRSANCKPFSLRIWAMAAESSMGSTEEQPTLLPVRGVESTVLIYSA